MKKTKAFITMALLMLSVGAYGCSPYANRDSKINPITGKIYNDTNSISRYNGPGSGYYNNTVGSGYYNNTESFGYYNHTTTTRANDGVINNTGSNSVLNNTRSDTRFNLTIGDNHTFTSNIINRHSIDTGKVSNIRKGMTYDEVIALTGIAPYFKNQTDAAVANNRQSGISYYFVNGRTLNISFVNGIVDRVYY